MATTEEVKKYGRGTLVESLRHLDKSGANVLSGTRGVVFEEYDYYGDGGGPMVRWFTGGACNVYDGEVKVLVAVA